MFKVNEIKQIINQVMQNFEKVKNEDNKEFFKVIKIFKDTLIIEFKKIEVKRKMDDLADQQKK